MCWELRACRLGSFGVAAHSSLGSGGGSPGFADARAAIDKAAIHLTLADARGFVGAIGSSGCGCRLAGAHATETFLFLTQGPESE